MNGHLIEGISNGVGSYLDGVLGGLYKSVGTLTVSVGKLYDGLGLGVIGGLVGGIGKSLLFIGGLVYP